MTEKEILEWIKQSAEEIEIPESLSPEKILEKCKGLEQDNTEEAVIREMEGKREPEKKFRKSRGILAGLSVAAVFIICCISLRGTDRMKVADETGAPEMAAATEGTAEESAEEALEETGDMGQGDFADAAKEAPERKNAGELYTLAEGYDAVYDRLEEEIRVEDNGGYDAVYTEGIMESAEDMAGAAGGMKKEAARAESGAENSIQNTAMEMSEDAGTNRYSETNVQTAGIDESDVVKTDGEYIYLLRGSCVSIVKAGEEKLESVCALEAESESGSAEACAMYVDGNTLILMIQETRTSLEQQAGKQGEESYDISYMDTGAVTTVLTYDISDKKSPELLGKVEQEGSYTTSRKDGSTIYLFTGKYLLDDYNGEESGVIPKVNGKPVAEDCIYIGERGTRALIISSVSLRKPEAARDTVMILDEGAEIYMGADSLYLYSNNYQNGGDITEIAKFTMKGGYLNGAAATSLKGTIRDTFAINEKDNRLRVLTTDFSGNDWENNLFLLDENLKLTGKLGRIAVGESIYAARYLGDMAYFITYRNMDPLFAVDISDETSPKLVGELEITGFSEYLHFWGEDKLLGIGYETDSSNGSQIGLKLVMFDKSDSAELKIAGTKVLKNVNSSPALYDYKTVLVDPEENLIGFVTETYQNGAKYRYELYRWNGKTFDNILSEDIKDGYDTGSYRGLYINDRFYIAHPEIIRYYDRSDYGLKQKFEPGKESK